MAREHFGAQVTVGLLRIFVYGTLKRGYWNHDRFCRGALHIEEATVRGRLYHMPSGIPVLQIPEDDILAVGTRDIAADTGVQEQQASMLTPPGREPPEAQEVVYGELLTFDDPARRLSPIDRLEGFRPGQFSLYRRVLAPVFAGKGAIAAWVYVADSEESIRSYRRLTSGRWERDSRV